MSPLAIVLCKKAAFEIHPYDSSQTGMLGAGAGALLGGAAAGLGSYALAPKSKKRTSDSLKAALIGALGGGALGGYAGYNYGADNLKKTWEEGYKPNLGGDENGNLASVIEQNGGVRDLYLAARKKVDGSRAMSLDQFERLQDDTPSRRLGGLLLGTTQDLKEPAIARASDAFRGRIEDTLKDKVTMTPGKLISSLWKGEGPPVATEASNAETAGDYKWLRGEGPPTDKLVGRMIDQYQH